MQPTVDDLMRVTREKLNIMAEARGIDPARYERKRELAEALAGAGIENSAQDAPNDGDPSVDTDTADNAPQEPNTAPEREGWIHVRATGPASRTALFERHRDHEGGQVFIRGGDTVTVPPTPGVFRALQLGKLERA